MGGEGVRHPTLSILRLIPHFNFNSSVNILKEKKKILSTWFLKRVTHTHNTQKKPLHLLEIHDLKKV